MYSSISSILNVARSAIFANQAGVRISSQNIANAQSEGYSRRVVRMAEARTESSPIGRLGTGVQLYGVTRVRDHLLDSSFRQESTKASGYELRHDVLGRIEQVYGEPSEEGLAASLDAFWGAWSDLANRPSNPTARRTVQQRGSEVAATLNSFDRRLDDVQQHARFRLGEAVQSINGMAEQIARLNREIVSGEVGGQEAHDLRDQRDHLLDQLSTFGSVRVLDRGRGSIAVMVENTTLIDGPRSRKLGTTGEPPTVTVEGVPLDVSSTGSRLGELVRTLNTDIPDARSRLNELASAVVTQVNALHTRGFAADGTRGGNFFDPTRVTASTITLDSAIASDPTRIVTSDAADQSTNNRVALALSALQRRPAHNSIAQEIVPDWNAVSASLNGRSIGEYYEDIVTETGLQVSSAGSAAKVYGSIAEQANSRRQSVSGVSTDEELMKLMSYQQAYTAATKVVTTVDEMLQTVLNMV